MGIFLACFAARLEEEIWDIIGESQQKVKCFKILPKKPTIKNERGAQDSQYLRTRLVIQ
jgi:hypothetical protein